MPKRKPPEPKATDAEIVHNAVTSILVGLSALSDLDKFTLAALIDWMRSHWCGSPAELASTAKLVDAWGRIERAAEKDRVEVLARAAEDHLRAAVTS